MIFSPKPKGFFVEQNGHTVLVARTSGVTAPIVIEEVCECPVGDADALKEALQRIQPAKTRSNYLVCRCGVYPPRRVVRCGTLELKRLKEPGYLNEVVSTQLRIEPEQYIIHVLNAPDGTDLDVSKPTQKEGLFCGVSIEELKSVQQALLTSGIYPERLELGSVASLGGLVNYLGYKESSAPTLVLEIGGETTHSFIITSEGIQAARPVPYGFESMVPLVQKELGLKDLESARKLFVSNTFDFTGMGTLLIKRLMKELQSSIGFFEVQTGQSVTQVICLGTPRKLVWIDGVIATALGVPLVDIDLVPWLQEHKITVSDSARAGFDARWFGLVSLMVSHTPPPPSSADALVSKKKA